MQNVPKFPLKKAEHGSSILAYWSGYLHVKSLNGSLVGSVRKRRDGKYDWQAVWETYSGPGTYVVLAALNTFPQSSYREAATSLHVATEAMRALIGAQQSGEDNEENTNEDD